MAVKSGELESDLIDAVARAAKRRLPDGAAELAERFVRQYYHWVPASDLSGRGPEDLLAAALAHLELASIRAPKQTKVRVFNPEGERDGYDSPSTVVEIVSDDMPFIVDSVTMELGRQGREIELAIHPVIRVRRDPEGRLVELLTADAEEPGATAESVLRAEIGREADPARLTALARGLERVLGQVRAAVEDWPAMRERALGLVEELEREPPPISAEEIHQGRRFLEWLAADHFTFLGYREYKLEGDRSERQLRAIADTGLGILRGDPAKAVKSLQGHAAELARTPYLLVLTKANSRSTVHRPAHLDYIGVKCFGGDGQVVGERRFLGLYTSSAYRASPLQIPLLREKVAGVLDRAGFASASHDRKALLEILEAYPRDALVQIGGEDLFRISMGLLRLGERPRVRLFAWTDPLQRFVACTVTIPRDRFNTENRERAGQILLEELSGSHLEHTLQLSESVLVRVNYVVWCEEGVPPEVDVDAIEARIICALRGWPEALEEALQAEHDQLRASALHQRYATAFPPGYRSDADARDALRDIDELERLGETGGVRIRLYRPEQGSTGQLRCRLYTASPVTLSDVLPTFEHMGARVIDERPYAIDPADAERVWIYDFGLDTQAEDLERVSGLFEDTFLAVKRGEYEDDAFNGLVLRAALSGREIVILRATARYLRQAGIPYSDAYMERTLNAHPDIARLLVKLFCSRFDPDQCDPELGDRLARAMEMAIDGVRSLDEDRILRGFLAVIGATVRTNYFRTDSQRRSRPFLSLKLAPSGLKVIPRPRPQFEVFVYSPRFQGVHLRGGPVARGGIRWSDRPEDFRSEVLGLMKAQMVKNALIVPVGAKGGFVLKSRGRPSEEDRREEAVACYRMFLCGLLDLTDNIVDGEVRCPERVIRYDSDDSYLVVAADKGTAAFSDIANQISDGYGYWLGDAFASGGSCGYDHKRMGITARGAWESVKRHFRELSTDIQSCEFTVVGIGDMSGDVFGNAMLLSRHIKLVGAFDHRHVFLDPDPDPERSFAERRRLFDQPGSTWMDYDADAISAGGGVYDRGAKSIRLSPQVRRRLAIDAEALAPAELIREMLRAPVDLLFNGGIGTYVKATDEAHGDAMDKANDALRVDGRELRCRVVGEGGNLGFTQRGRIEYARAGGPDGGGGRINTDAIDNVAGVNTSDHEVNIKILLDSQVAGGELEIAERNRLLVEMTDTIADQVLYDSYVQTQAISLALAQAPQMVDVHGRLIRWLEQHAELDRELEALPDDEEISARKSAHRGLVAPEIAVVMAYCKIKLYSELLASDLPENDYLSHELEHYFPRQLSRFPAGLRSHRLRREIIATVVANELVDRAGTTFVFRVGEETGVPMPLLARAFTVVRRVFDLLSFWRAVEGLDGQVDAGIQLQMLIEGRRLAERSTRALVREHPAGIDIATTVARYRPGVECLQARLDSVLDPADRETLEARATELADAGVPGTVARRVAAMPYQPAIFDVVTVADQGSADLASAIRIYFEIVSRLELGWLRDRIVELPRENRWQALARTAMREELLAAQRELTREVLAVGPADGDPQAAIERWWERRATGIERLIQTLAEIRASRLYDTTTLSVALRELRALVRAPGA